MTGNIYKTLAEADNRVLLFFNKACRCHFLDRTLEYLTELGSTRFLFLVALLMLPFKKNNIRRYGVVLMAGITMASFFSRILKELFMRPRPYLNVDGASAVVGAWGYAFPSGHTTTAFMGAFVLSKCFGKHALFYTLAVIVALSRIYLGVHYPTDVAAGAALGTFVGYFVVRISGTEGS